MAKLRSPCERELAAEGALSAFSAGCGSHIHGFLSMYRLPRVNGAAFTGPICPIWVTVGQTASL